MSNYGPGYGIEPPEDPHRTPNFSLFFFLLPVGLVFLAFLIAVLMVALGFAGHGG